MDSLTGEGEPPEAYESWLEHLTHLAAEAMAEVLDIEGIVTDKTLTVDGGIADAKATGDALSALEDAVTEETDKLKADLEAIVPGLSGEAKRALLDCFAHVAWIDKNGQDYYDALEDALADEEDTNIIYVHRGIGVPSHVPAPVANRAMSEPIPFENKVPITIQVNLENTSFSYNFKFCDVNEEIIDNDKIQSSSGVHAVMTDDNGRTYNGWVTDNNILLTLKQTTDKQESKIGLSKDGRVPDNHFRLLFANASNSANDLPAGEISGTVTVQGVVYRLVTSE
jgi:hypothetical protein